jgi:hypothetical protein
MFRLVRVLLAHPDLAQLSARDAYKRAMRSLPQPLRSEECKVAFFDAWESVRLPAGVNPLHEAHRRALDCPLGLHPNADNSRPASYQVFVSLAGWLCVVLGSDKIKLPCTAVGKVLGVCAMTVTRYRRFAVRDRYLTLTKPARYRPDGNGEATLFRFDVERWQILVDALAS